MADQVLRDSKNQLIGKISTAPNGVMTLRDAKNSLKGTYDPKAKTTRDAHGKLVGTGNILTTLL
jgi:hypothetical protein